MNSIVKKMGQLVELKALNRDDLAARIGLTRSNMIGAFKGRRTMPAGALSRLRGELGLDERYKFTTPLVHGLLVKDGLSQEPALVSALSQFMTWPVLQAWYLCFIGETPHSKAAYVLADAKQALVAILNEDMLLFTKTTSYDSDQDQLVRQAFTAGLAGDYREISEAAFHTLFAGKMPSSVLLKVIEEHRWIWTWDRLSAQAQRVGLSPDDVAKQLGFRV